MPCKKDDGKPAFDQTSGFQSLSGFRMPCKAGLMKPSATSMTPFQSLSGFRMPCKGSTSHLQPRSRNSFNPCRVFGCLARVGLAIDYLANMIVSIPVGFSDALQARCVLWPRSIEIVSIPVGFSDALQASQTNTIPADVVQFQSLSGFRMPCKPLRNPRRDA